MFSVLKLRTVGLLWTDDKDNKKALEFYDIVVDEMSVNNKRVTCNDRDL